MNKIIIVLLIVFSSQLFAQSGIKFLEFAKRIEPYFNESMIADIKNQLPQNEDYFIWGYDVGDFSGDPYYDIAVTLRIAGDRSKNMQVYLFADIDGFLKQVHQESIEFIELPLEVGVAIRQGACYVTKKQKQYNWDIYGYRYQNGNLIQKDEFYTRKLKDLTYEKYRNYDNLKASEKYINLKSNKSNFERDFSIIPSYSRGRRIYSGYADGIKVDNVDYIYDGAYWWKGAEDCSYYLTSVYDNEYLYFTAEVNDDYIVVQNCDTCIADHITLAIDINQYDTSDRFADKSEDKVKFRKSITNGLYMFDIYPGDFIKTLPYCKVSTTDSLSNEQKYESKDIKVIADYNDSKYIVKFKIPFNLFGNKLTITKNNGLELGATIMVTDYDNEFRPEEYSILSTSNFKIGDSSTLGILKIIPEKHWYGHSTNIFIDDVVKNLLINGF
ncbi:MAG TPA: hypothetical protein PLE30_05185 [Candidatus Kapabacteria bacterium]|nr:hypothetical protein [Candidatus Kapabacteria bacterium]